MRTLGLLVCAIVISILFTAMAQEGIWEDSLPLDSVSTIDTGPVPDCTGTTALQDADGTCITALTDGVASDADALHTHASKATAADYLPLAGGTMVGPEVFSDNISAVFGTDSDYQVYYDEATYDNLIFTTDSFTYPAGANGLYRFLVDGSSSQGVNIVGKIVLFIGKGNPTNAVPVFTVDSEGDQIVWGDMNISFGTFTVFGDLSTMDGTTTSDLADGFADLTIGSAFDGLIQFGNGNMIGLDSTVGADSFSYGDVLRFIDLGSEDNSEDVNFLFQEGTLPMFSIAEDVAGVASYSRQSLVIGPETTEGGLDEAMICSTNFPNIDCDSATGADFGVEDDAEILGDLFVGSDLNVGVHAEFTPHDAYTDCSAFSATGGGIFYDDSEGIFKKCQDNTLTDMDTGGGGGGAPTGVDYLVGTADATLTNEIVVGVTPGGDLGGTWASPTVSVVGTVNTTEVCQGDGSAVQCDIATLANLDTALTSSIADLAVANTWLANQTFNDTIDLIFGTTGDASIRSDGTNLLINPTLVSASAITDFTGAISVAVDEDVISKFGGDPTNAAVSDQLDTLYTRKHNTGDTTKAKRALLVLTDVDFDGTTSKFQAGLNSFVYTGFDYTTNLTSTNPEGSAIGGRYAVRHYGQGDILKATGVASTIWLGDTTASHGLGNITEAVAFVDEGGWRAVQASGVITDYIGFQSRDLLVAGGVTNKTGVWVEDLTNATTASYGVRLDGADTYALWFANDSGTANDGIWFGTGGDTNLYRSAANTLKTDDMLSAYKPVATSTGGALAVNTTTIATAAADYDLPDECDSASGAWVTLLVRDTAEVVSLTVTDTSDTINYAGLTTMIADDELDSSGTIGDSVTVQCLETNEWYATSGLGSAWVDGGVAD